MRDYTNDPHPPTGRSSDASPQSADEVHGVRQEDHPLSIGIILPNKNGRSRVFPGDLPLFDIWFLRTNTEHFDTPSIAQYNLGDHIARIKEFKGSYAELKKRIDRLSWDTRSGAIPKIAADYGRVLENCASCHAKFRD